MSGSWIWWLLGLVLLGTAATLLLLLVFKKPTDQSSAQTGTSSTVSPETDGPLVQTGTSDTMVVQTGTNSPTGTLVQTGTNSLEQGTGTSSTTNPTTGTVYFNILAQNGQAWRLGQNNYMEYGPATQEGAFYLDEQNRLRLVGRDDLVVGRYGPLQTTRIGTQDIALPIVGNNFRVRLVSTNDTAAHATFRFDQERRLVPTNQPGYNGIGPGVRGPIYISQPGDYQQIVP